MIMACGLTPSDETAKREYCVNDGRYLHRAELRLPGGLRFSPDGVALVGSDLYALCLDGEGWWSLRRFAVEVPEGS